MKQYAIHAQNAMHCISDDTARAPEYAARKALDAANRQGASVTVTAQHWPPTPLGKDEIGRHSGDGKPTELTVHLNDTVLEVGRTIRQLDNGIPLQEQHPWPGRLSG